MFFVYADCKPDGTPFYIGKGSQYRVNRLVRRNQHHKNITSKYPGWYRGLAFMSSKQEDARKKEMELIAKYGRSDNGTGILCNKTDGGEGSSGLVVPNEVRLSISQSLKGKLVSEETKLKISQKKQGSKHTDESKDKMRIVKLGKKSSEETKAKLSAIRKGKPVSAETRQKMSLSSLGKTPKKFICLDCGKVVGGHSNIIQHQRSSGCAGKAEL